MLSRPLWSGACPHSPMLRGKCLQELTSLKFASHLIGRRPSPLTTKAFRRSRRSRDTFVLRLKASSAASVADQASISTSRGTSSSLLTAFSRRWHSYWSLGRPQKQQQEKNPKKLTKIVSKLWSIMDVNKLLLTAALFCMVGPLMELITTALCLESFLHAPCQHATSFHVLQLVRHC